MKKLVALVVFLWGVSAAQAFFFQAAINGNGGSLPSIVAGSAAPQSQTPTMPSAEVDGPRCLDATWGSGCNVSTQHCIAPTSGTPLESCNPPAQFLINAADATATTGNGTTATVHYHSTANIAYVTASPLIISSAAQANWNTPSIQFSNVYSTSGSDTNCASGPSMTLGFAGTVQPFVAGKVAYIGGWTVNPSNNTRQNYGWGAGDPAAPTPNGKHTVAATGGSSGAWTVTLCTPHMPLGKFNISNSVQGSCATGGFGSNPCSYTNVALTGGSGTGATATITVQTGIGVLSISTAGTGNTTGVGYKVGDVLTATLGTGTVFTATILNGVPTANTLGTYGYGVQPWVVSSSSCSGGACTVAFANPNSCASSCVTADGLATGTQIAAGQFTDVIMAWDFGENVNYTTYLSGNVRQCVAATSIGAGTYNSVTYDKGVQYVDFEVDGGAFTQVTTPVVDPNGAGQSGLDISHVKVFCAQVPVAGLADGEHKMTAIACPVVGYCGRLTSVIAIDGSASSSYFTAPAHGMPSFKLVGITNSFDSAFPNFNWQYNTTTLVQSTAAFMTSSGTTASSSVTLSYTGTIVGLYLPFAAGQTVGLSGYTVSNNSCTVTGGSHSGTGPGSGALTINLTGTCNFPTGSTVNIASIVSSGGNGYTWNGSRVAVTTGGVCAAGTCSIVVPGLSTATYSSGGAVTSNINGKCVVSSGSAGSVTCPGTFHSGDTASGGTINAFGNTFCVVGGNGDNPSPYTPYTTVGATSSPFGSQMNTDSFQLIAFTTAPATCGGTQNNTGCAATPCGLVPTGTETLWVWRRDAGLDERRAIGDAKVDNVNSAFYFFTNASHTIKTTRAHVDSWNPSSSTSITGACNESPTYAGAPLSAYAGTTCTDVHRAVYGLQAAGGLTASTLTPAQTLTNDGTGNHCLIFSNSANNSSPAFYVGEPVNMVYALDTNANPQITAQGLYWIVQTGAGSGTGIVLAAKPGGTCIGDTASGIIGGGGNASTTSTAALAADVSFDSILLACNTSVSPACSTSNPEQFIDAPTNTSNSSVMARAGWLNVDPDTADGAAINNTSMIIGNHNWFGSVPSQGGRVRFGVGSLQSDFLLTPLVAVGPTPGITTITGGSLATCAAPNAAHQCETLTFAAVHDPATNSLNGAAYQAPTGTGSPGQSIVATPTVTGGSGWTCGTTDLLPCLGAAGGVAGIIGSTSTSVTFINDSATAATVTGGTIKPTNIVLELTAGSISYNASTNPLSLCATDGSGSIGNIAFATTGSLCIAGYSPSGNLFGGTTAGAFPLFMFSANSGNNTNLAENSNCLPLKSGNTAQSVQATQVQSLTPAAKSGATHDILTLNYSGYATQPMAAYNACVFPLHFANNNFSPVGTGTDIWLDSTTISGANISSSYNGFAGPSGQTNAVYVTNSIRSNAEYAFDLTSYAWGGLSTSNNGLCINQSGNVFSVKCINAGPGVVTSTLGGSVNPTGNSFSKIVDAFDINGVETTCSGAPCVTNSSDLGTRTVTYALDYPMPYFFSNWDVSIACGVTANSNSGSGVTITNAALAVSQNSATNPPTVTLPNSAISATNCIIATGNAIAIPYNVIHIDFDFWNYSGDGAPAGGGSYSFFMHHKDLVQENAWCVPCGSVEGIFDQGSNIVNMAFEDGGLTLTQLSGPSSQFSFVGLTVGGGELVTNWILRNSVNTGFASDSNNAVPAQYTNTYVINVTGGVQTTFPSSVAFVDPANTGFWSALAAALSPSHAGGADQWAVWPTGALSVDSSGQPSVANDPSPNSLYALPWYGVTDTGLGSY